MSSETQACIFRTGTLVESSSDKRGAKVVYSSLFFKAGAVLVPSNSFQTRSTEINPVFVLVAGNHILRPVIAF